jgi:enediyne biosynthesis protein E4
MDSAVAQRLEGMQLGPPDFPEHQKMRPKLSYGNRLYLGRGGKFAQTPLSEQVAQTGWSWGVSAFDCDNDGDLDLYVANGHKSRASAKDYDTQFWRHDIYLGTSKKDPVLDVYFRAKGAELYGAGYSYGGYDKNRLLMNEDGKSFLEIGWLMDVAMEEDCRNAVSGDLDNDGRVDLLVTTFEQWPQLKQSFHLFKNQWPAAGNWIGFRLRESGSGYSPVGAKITLTTSAGKQIRRLVTGDSYRAQHDNSVHFGLGKLTGVEMVEVTWPNGKSTTATNPVVNRYHAIAPK